MKKKWIIAQGLAFEEEQEKLRLEKLAQEGWLFEKIALSGLCWVLVQGEPQFRQYEFDYLPADQAEQQEYLQWMEEAGWHLAFCQSPIALFWTTEKQPPVHTDAATKLASYAPIKRQFKNISVILGLLLIGLLISGLKGKGIALIYVIGLVFFVMTMMSASGYAIRMQLLQRQLQLQEKIQPQLRKQIILCTTFAHLLLIRTALYLMMIAYAQKAMPVGLWVLIALQFSAGVVLKLISWKQLKDLG